MSFFDELDLRGANANARQLICSRQFRALSLTVLGLFILLQIFIYSTFEDSSKDAGPLSRFRFSWQWNGHKSDKVESPLLKPSNLTLELQKSNATTVPVALKKATPSFHLLLHAPRPNQDVCRSVLSSMVLHYPPATVLNWDTNFESDHDEHLAKVRGVRNYLRDGSNIEGDDLVVIADAANAYFQLPAEVLLREYEALVQEKEAQLLKMYGADFDPSTQTSEIRYSSSSNQHHRT